MELSKSDTYGNLKAMDWYSKNDLKVMGATAGQTRWTLMLKMKVIFHK